MSNALSDPSLWQAVVRIALCDRLERHRHLFVDNTEYQYLSWLKHALIAGRLEETARLLNDVKRVLDDRAGACRGCRRDMAMMAMALDLNSRVSGMVVDVMVDEIRSMMKC